MTKQVDMIALRDFPMAQGGSRTIVRAGSTYTIVDTDVKFHEKTGRGERKSQPKSTPKPKFKGE